MTNCRRLKWSFDHSLWLLYRIETSGNWIRIENVIQLFQYHINTSAIAVPSNFSDASNAHSYYYNSINTSKWIECSIVTRATIILFLCLELSKPYQMLPKFSLLWANTIGNVFFTLWLLVCECVCVFSSSLFQYSTYNKFCSFCYFVCCILMVD